MTEQEIQQWKDKIDKMSHLELANLWRFAPAGHPTCRTDLPIYEYFKNRFAKLGGMTPEISKELGW